MLHTVVIQVDGMHCDGCSHRLGTVLGRLAGVRHACAEHYAGRVRITFNPAQTEFAELVDLIENAGFQVTGTEPPDPASKEIQP